MKNEKEKNLREMSEVDTMNVLSKKENFKGALISSYEEHGLIEPLVICKFGIISGKSRSKMLITRGTIKEDEQWTKKKVEAKGWTWRDVTTKEEYFRLRAEAGLIRNSKRTEIADYAEDLSKAGIPKEQIVSKIYAMCKGRIPERTIQRYLPSDLKRKHSSKRQFGGSTEMGEVKIGIHQLKDWDCFKCPCCHKEIQYNRKTRQVEKFKE